MKHPYLRIAVLLSLFLFCAAAAESVTNIPYTYRSENALYDGFYTGEISDGLPEGFGLFIVSEGDLTRWHYIGFWEEGLPHGQGAIYYEDGRVEKGMFEKGSLIAAETVTASAGNGQYIGNIKTRAFHDPSCPSVNEMKPENKTVLTSRQEAISQGYRPCGRCKP